MTSPIARKMAATQAAIDRINAILANPFANRGLDPKDEHIARLVALGQTGDEIADELGVHRQTVAYRMKKICGVLNCTAADLPRLMVEQIAAVSKEAS